MTRLARFVAVAALLIAMLAAPASADPPSTNKNTSVLTFDCTRGFESTSFQAIAIAQSLSVSGHLLDGTGTIVFVHIELGGQVIFDVPGQAGRSDLWTCTIREVPGALVQAILTPRR
jgi:hypothetical protein